MLKRYVSVPLLLLLLMPIIPIFIVSADSTILAVNPPNSYVTIGKSLSVDVNVTDVANLTSWQFTMYFLNSVLNCTNATEGSFLKTGGSTYFGKIITNNYNGTHGKLVAYSTLLGTTKVDGSGTLATVTFDTLSVGVSPLHLTDTKLGDEKIPPQPIPHTIIDGTVYVQNFTLTVSTVGSGTVALNNTEPYYHYSEAVQLTANPATGWSFDHWSGNLTGSSNPATLIITGNMSANATFTQDQYTLTVTIVGQGSVGKGPDQATYTYGTVVTLTANPDADWSFQYWSGALSGSTSPTTINMTTSFSVTAHFVQKPTLQMSPTSKTCRVYSENFTVAIAVSNAANVTDFELEIRYNTTLLDYVAVTWNVWGTGTISIDEPGGKITVSNAGAPISGTQTLVTINFTASYYHIWKAAAGWTNNLTDAIFFQWANISYPSGPDLHYERGDSSQINVGPDFAYTFSPIQGDVNNDGTVDLYDLREEAYYFGSKEGDPDWTSASKYDLDGDKTISVYDLRIVAVNFGYTYIP